MVKKLIIYDYLHKKMTEKLEVKDRYLDLRKAKSVMYSFGIPKHLTHKVLREMKSLGIVEEINKRNIKIKKMNKKGWFE